MRYTVLTTFKLSLSKIIFMFLLYVFFISCVRADLGRINIRMSATIVSSSCTVVPSDKNIIVNLPDYPGTSKILISINCPYDRGVKYILSGPTSNLERTIFTNTESNSPAKGFGIQMSDRYGIVPAQTERDLITKSGSDVNLEFDVSYALTSSEVSPGNVKSEIGLTFIYP